MSACATMERTGTEARAWTAYGRVYRVEKSGKSGMYWAVGRARGLRPAFLDRLGPRDTKQAMQTALDGVATRGGWSEVKA